MGLLDLFFPKTCVGCKKLGIYLCFACLNSIEYLKEQTCCVCYKNSISGKTHSVCQTKTKLDGVVSLTSYSGVIKKLVKSLKYNFTTDLVKEVFEKINFDNPIITEKKDWVLVPVPLNKQRKNFRGFNQAELLGEVFAKKYSLKFDQTVLERSSSTSSQVGLSQKQRTENVKEAFRVRQKISDQNFFVFDDVWTSGATLKEIAKILKKAGAQSVWGLTLAHPR